MGKYVVVIGGNWPFKTDRNVLIYGIFKVFTFQLRERIFLICGQFSRPLKQHVIKQK